MQHDGNDNQVQSNYWQYQLESVFTHAYADEPTYTAYTFSRKYMKWEKRNMLWHQIKFIRANINCADRSVTLTHPSGDIIQYWSPSSVYPSEVPLVQADFYALEAIPPLDIQDVQVVCDFPDVFPDRKSTRLNSSHITRSRMPSSA